MSSEGLARICAGTLQMNGVDAYEMGVMPTPWSSSMSERSERARGS